MFNWLRKKLQKLRSSDSCSVKISIKDTLAFAGEVESFDISTDVDGSDAKVVIKFKASELLNKLTVRRT